MLKSKLFALTLTAFAAGPLAAETLAEQIDDYVAAFDMSALDSAARAELTRIIAHPTASHGDKVIAVHAVLDARGALRHLDLEMDSVDNTLFSSNATGAPAAWN